MSEQKKERTLEDIKQEFVNVASSAGQAQYQIHVLYEELDVINQRLKDLNQEAAALAKAGK